MEHCLPAKKYCWLAQVTAVCHMRAMHHVRGRPLPARVQTGKKPWAIPGQSTGMRNETYIYGTGDLRVR